MHTVLKLSLGLLFCLCLNMFGQCEEPVQGEDSEIPSSEKRLQGLWNVVTLSETHEGYLLLSGNRMYSLIGPRVHAVSFTVDSSKSPPHIDVNGHDGDRKVRMRGIYKLQENGWLFIVLAEGDNPRPTGFKSDQFKEGESQMMLVRGRQSIKAGQYTGKVNGQSWSLILDANDGFTLSNEQQAVFSGHYVSSKTDLIVLSRKKSKDTERLLIHSGRYRWKVDGKALSLTPGGDNLDDRKQVLAATQWWTADD